MGSAFFYCEACGAILPIEGQKVCGVCRHKQSGNGLTEPPSASQFTTRPAAGPAQPGYGQPQQPQMPSPPPNLSPFARQAAAGAAQSWPPSGQGQAPGAAPRETVYESPSMAPYLGGYNNQTQPQSSQPQYGGGYEDPRLSQPQYGGYESPDAAQYGRQMPPAAPPSSPSMPPAWASAPQNPTQPWQAGQPSTGYYGQPAYGAGIPTARRRSALPIVGSVVLVLLVVAGLFTFAVLKPFGGASQAAASATPTTSPTASPTPAVTPEPQFVLGPNMTSARSGETATVLEDGRVLIAGGWMSTDGTSRVPTATADIYDPSTMTLTATGSMATPRAAQQATLLADGRVLVTGGSNGENRLYTAELYDPKTGKFSDTGSMNEARIEDTQTLLTDGRVLVVGGYNTGDRLATAELYDPKTGRFTLTGSMAAGRGEHVAGLLKDGRVIVAGGDNNDNPLSTAELYDPKTGKFTSTGALVGAREYASSAVLPDGRFLVVGGDRSGSLTLNTAEVYDPATGSFTATENMGRNREMPTVAVLKDGSVLVAGGWSDHALNSTELFDPATNTFVFGATLQVPRAEAPAAVLLDGSVLICGGLTSETEILSSVEIYGGGGAAPGLSPAPATASPAVWAPAPARG